MAIYVKFAEIKKPKTVLKFLKLFYSRSINSYNAIGHVTYFDKECNQIQDFHQWRSFDDLLELTQTYYPSIKPLKLMHYLLILKIKLSDTTMSKPHLNVCGVMGKIRYIPYKECGYDSSIGEKMYNSKYTWSELLVPLGITTRKQFLEYIK